MKPAEYLEHLRADGPAILQTGRASPATKVPSCPEWTLSELVGHVASATHWVEEMVRTRTSDFCPFPERPEGFEAVCSWFEEGLSALADTLADTDPDEPVWNWVEMGPGPARFWFRRVTHEMSIHRWDAQNALGAADPIGAELALDGIDEYLTIASRWLELGPGAGLTGCIGLETTDGAVICAVTLAPDKVERSGGLHGAEAVVRAAPSDLLLWLVGRRTIGDPAIEVDGELDVARVWSQLTFG